MSDLIHRVPGAAPAEEPQLVLGHVPGGRVARAGGVRPL